MKSCSRYIGFDDRLLRLIGVPVLGFLIPITFFGKQVDSIVDYLPKWIEASIFALTYWEGARYIVILLRKHFHDFEDTRKRIFWQFLLVTIFMNLIGLPLGLLLDATQLFDLHNPTFFQLTAVNITTILIFLSIYESIYFYDQLKSSITEQERLKQETIRSQLEGLRNQVNPHFLFNSLNTLMSIVAEDKKLAISFLKKLSKVYRYVLDIREKKLVPLQEELEFIHSYIFLQQERFGENLCTKIEVDPSLGQHKIVPLSMQILFENAIKHNIISSKKPLHIQVFTKRDEYLIVRNNLQKKKQAMISTKVGLENIRNRYRFFTDSEVVVQETEDLFEVAIPLLKL
ncbi:MAG: histidine kinase [Bacteroidota bacterium]